MARPRLNFDVLEVLRLRLAGLSWPSIARKTGLGYGTVYRAYRAALVKLAAVQNPAAAKIGRVGEINRKSENDRPYRHDLRDVHGVHTQF